jgi:hypothetical protein
MPVLYIGRTVLKVKVHDSRIQVADIFVYINSSFQIFLMFAPDMCTRFTSYNVWVL